MDLGLETLRGDTFGVQHKLVTKYKENVVVIILKTILLAVLVLYNYNDKCSAALTGSGYVNELCESTEHFSQSDAYLLNQWSPPPAF